VVGYLINYLPLFDELYRREHGKYLAERLDRLEIIEVDKNSISSDTFVLVGFTENDKILEDGIQQSVKLNIPLLILAGYARQSVSLKVPLNYQDYIASLEINKTTRSNELSVESAFSKDLNLSDNILTIDSDMTVESHSRIPMAVCAKPPYKPLIVDISPLPELPIVVCTTRIEQIHGTTKYEDQLKLLKALLSYIFRGKRVDVSQSPILKQYADEELVRNHPLLQAFMMAGVREATLKDLQTTVESISSEYPWISCNLDTRNNLVKKEIVEIKGEMLHIKSDAIWKIIAAKHETLPSGMRELIGRK